MGRTSIEWATHSWPIVNGCRHVSDGCSNCYAERLAATRLRHRPQYAGLARMTEDGPRWTGETRLWEPYLDYPLRLRGPARIFVANMGDLFYPGVRERDMDRVFGVMLACHLIGKGHAFLVLTKRCQVMRDYLTQDPVGLLQRWARCADEVCTLDDPDVTCWDTARTLCSNLWKEGRAVAEHRDWGYPQSLFPLPNVWLGTSMEDQETFERRILAFADAVMSAERPRPLGRGGQGKWHAFLSLEPLLGPIDMGDYVPDYPSQPDWEPGGCRSFLDWIIVGGESGPRARPCHVEHVRQILRQCEQGAVPAFLKQFGRWIAGDPTGFIVSRYRGDGRVYVPPVLQLDGAEFGRPPPAAEFGVPDTKGANPLHWPEDLRVRQLPGDVCPPGETPHVRMPREDR